MSAPRKFVFYSLMVIGGIALLIFAVRWWHYHTVHQDTDDAYVMAHLHPIGSRIDGTVAHVYVQENHWVKQGDLLLQLDPRDYEIQKQQAAAALLAAQRQANISSSQINLTERQTKASLLEAKGGVKEAVSTIQSAQAGVNEFKAAVLASKAKLREAEANLAKAGTDYHRYQSVDPQAISKLQLDAAQNAYDVARNARDQAAEELREVQSHLSQVQKGVINAQAKLVQSQGRLENASAGRLQIPVQENQFSAARANIEQAKAALKNAELQLAYTRIYAPVSGRIGRKNAETGQRVQAGQVLFSIVEPKPWVTANFKETQLERMRLGQSAEMTIDAFPHHPFKGKIESLSPASGAQFAVLPPENATGNFTKVVQRIPVKIIFNEKSIQGFENRITPGMSVIVSVKTQ